MILFRKSFLLCFLVSRGGGGGSSQERLDLKLFRGNTGINLFIKESHCIATAWEKEENQFEH